MDGTEYFGETAVQPRDHAEITQSNTFAALLRLSNDYPLPRKLARITTIIFSRLTQAKYHR